MKELEKKKNNLPNLPIATFRVGQQVMVSKNTLESKQDRVGIIIESSVYAKSTDPDDIHYDIFVPELENLQYSHVYQQEIKALKKDIFNNDGKFYPKLNEYKVGQKVVIIKDRPRNNGMYLYMTAVINGINHYNKECRYNVRFPDDYDRKGYDEKGTYYEDEIVLLTKNTMQEIAEMLKNSFINSVKICKIQADSKTTN